MKGVLPTLPLLLHILMEWRTVQDLALEAPFIQQRTDSCTL